MSEDVIDLLKQAYLDEIETATNYLANSIYLETFDGEAVSESLKADVQEELDHAEELGYRLRFYGEVPPASADLEVNQESLQPPEDGSDVRSVVEGVIEAEQDAIETYEKLIEAAQEAGDPVTEDLAVELLADEQAHLAEFRSFEKSF